MASPSSIKPLIVPAGPVGTFFARIALGLLNGLSRRARERLAGFVGGLAYALGIRRAVTLDNLRHAFPERSESELRLIARGAYRNMALAAVEALSSDQLTDEEIAAAVHIENWEPFEAAMRAGKGVLVASAHFGSWELLGEVLARRGVPLSAVVRPLKGAINARIVENRQKAGMQLILQRGAITGVLKAIREGRVVAQLVDQVLPARSGVFVPFFGRPASTTPALSIAALRTGAPVFAILAAREGEHLRMVVEGPIPFPRSGDRERDIKEHLTTLSAVLERHIRTRPEQWLWLHRRWKVQPPAKPT